MGRPVPIRAGVGASIPIKGEFLAAKLSLVMQAGGLPLAPLHPLRIASEVNEYPMKVISASLMPESARQTLPGAGVCACGRTKGLSSGQTIGAVRTAVRSACCLPELRVANRLRRLYPLDTRFPSFPPVPFGSPLEAIERPIGLQALLPRRNRRINPHQRGISSAEVSLCGTRRRHPSS